MRLIDRRDAALAVGLIVGTFIVFQRPLRYLLDAARDVETQYHLDLIPALTVLTALFVFHQYRKRQEAHAAASLAAAEARQARERSEELERLVIFGRTLANALDRSALRQALWQFLPRFIQQGEVWMLVREHGQWEPLLEDASSADPRSLEAREAIAARALADLVVEGAHVEGTRIEDTDCFTMDVGGGPVGVIGVGGEPGLTPRERRALGAASALIGIAVRNVQLFGEIRDNSLHDSLTGCANRAHAIATLDNELRRARRTTHSLSIVMFDIDHFKTINDTYGHLCGDRLLSAVGQSLRQLLRSTDVACRYGGDEFLIILPDTPLPGAERVAAVLRHEIATLPSPCEGAHAAVTASIGVARAVPCDDAMTLVARADEALYDAKHAGRDRVCVSPFPPDPPTDIAHAREAVAP